MQIICLIYILHFVFTPLKLFFILIVYFPTTVVLTKFVVFNFPNRTQTKHRKLIRLSTILLKVLRKTSDLKEIMLDGFYTLKLQVYRLASIWQHQSIYKPFYPISDAYFQASLNNVFQCIFLIKTSNCQCFVFEQGKFNTVGK